MALFPEFYITKSNTFIYPEEGQWVDTQSDSQIDLFSLLRETFGEKIQTLKKVILNGYGYKPDIAYIDVKNKIFIDIEVDEPYSKSGVITHYLGHPKDNYRNKLFIEAGWNIVRFSEQQVIQNAELCCQFIRRFIGICEKKHALNYLDDPYVKIQHSKWTLKDSQRFLKEEKREFYEYREEPILESDLKLISYHDSSEGLTDLILKRNFDQFGPENEFILLVTRVLNIKIHEKNSERLIAIEFLSHKVANGECSGHFFSGFVKYLIYERIDKDLFENLIDLKKSNRRYCFHDQYEKDYKVYTDLILFGNMSIYNSNKLLWKRIEVIPNKKDVIGR
jgi:hypothetical protein